MMLPPGALKVEYIKLSMQWKQSNRFVKILKSVFACNIVQLTIINLDAVNKLGFMTYLYYLGLSNCRS